MLVFVIGVPLDLGPTPPYTEVESPIQSRLGIPEDHPTQALQEMRQEMRDTTEDHEYGDSSSEQLRLFSSSFQLVLQRFFIRSSSILTFTHRIFSPKSHDAHRHL